MVRNVSIDCACQLRKLSLNFPATFGIAVKHHHRRAFFKEAPRRGRANSAGTARNQDTLSMKPTHSVEQESAAQNGMSG